MKMINVLNKLSELAKDSDNEDLKQAVESTSRYSMNEAAEIIEEHISEGKIDDLKDKKQAEKDNDWFSKKKKKSDDNDKSPKARQVKGEKYGGSKQKDDADKEEVEEGKDSKAQIKSKIETIDADIDSAVSSGKKVGLSHPLTKKKEALKAKLKNVSEAEDYEAYPTHRPGSMSKKWRVQLTYDDKSATASATVRVSARTKENAKLLAINKFKKIGMKNVKAIRVSQIATEGKIDDLNDKREAAKREKGDDSKSAVRQVKGNKYGGGKQKDDDEKDEVDESKDFPAKNDDKFYVVSSQGVESGPHATREIAKAKKDKAPAHGYRVMTGKQVRNLKLDEAVAKNLKVVLESLEIASLAGVKEAADSRIDSILKKYPNEVNAFLENGDLDMGTPFYEELFEYFMDTGEMPYGVAKARTGDPDEWIGEKLYNMFKTGEVGSDDAPEDLTPAGYAEDAPQKPLNPQQQKAIDDEVTKATRGITDPAKVKAAAELAIIKAKAKSGVVSAGSTIKPGVQMSSVKRDSSRQIREDVNVQITPQPGEDAMDTVRKLAGIPGLAITSNSPMAAAPAMPSGPSTVDNFDIHDTIGKLNTIGAMDEPAPSPMGAALDAAPAFDPTAPATGAEVDMPVAGMDSEIGPEIDASGVQGAEFDDADQGIEIDADADVEEDIYANSPDEIISDIDSVLGSGDDLHASVKTFHPSAGADNPMAAESVEARLWKKYKGL